MTKDWVISMAALLVATGAFTAAIRVTNEPMLFTFFCVMLGCGQLGIAITKSIQPHEANVNAQEKQCGSLAGKGSTMAKIKRSFVLPLSLSDTGSKVYQRKTPEFIYKIYPWREAFGSHPPGKIRVTVEFETSNKLDDTEP
jgi:hypothetical protein